MLSVSNKCFRPSNRLHSENDPRFSRKSGPHVSHINFQREPPRVHISCTQTSTCQIPTGSRNRRACLSNPVLQRKLLRKTAIRNQPKSQTEWSCFREVCNWHSNSRFITVHRAPLSPSSDTCAHLSRRLHGRPTSIQSHHHFLVSISSAVLAARERSRFQRKKDSRILES